ncbi:solute carrier family 2, facilitated glucose transporter member 9-like isoform X1 [Arapaima gigas]
MAEEVLITSPGKIRPHLTASLLAVTLLTSFGSSMLYGYNLAVVNSPAGYIKEFYNRTIVRRNGTGVSEKTLTVMYSLTVSVFAIGGLVGSLLVGMLVTKFGRRGTVVNSTVLVFVAGSLMGFSRICGSPEMVILGRFITGIHSGMPPPTPTHSRTCSRTHLIAHVSLLPGVSLSVVPMYLGEIAPKNLRGFLGLIPSIFICVGVFTAQILGLRELLGKDEHWPLFLSLVVVPTFIQLVVLPWFPESPRYLLMERRNVHATITALKWYRAKPNIQAEIEEMQQEQRSLSSVETMSVWQLLLDDSVRWQLLSVVVINIGMQLSGIDAIWFYTNDIFENADIPAPQIQYTTVGTGAIEVLAGLIGCFTIERLGRRPLIIGGFGFMGVCCAGITLSLVLQARVAFMRYVSVACVVGIIAGFCIGPAGVPFLMTAELFKQSHRPAAYTVGGSLNWISNFTVGFVFPFLQMSAGSFCYLVFCGVCLAVATYVFFIIPETKNKTFMEISQMFATREAMMFRRGDQLKLRKMNGYGALESSSVEFDSSASCP